MSAIGPPLCQGRGSCRGHVRDMSETRPIGSPLCKERVHGYALAVSENALANAPLAAACSADISKHCAAVQPGGGAGPRLWPSLLHAPSCEQVQPGGGRVLDCLERVARTRAHLAPQCAEQVLSQMAAELADPSTSFGLRRDCSVEASLFPRLGDASSETSPGPFLDPSCRCPSSARQRRRGAGCTLGPRRCRTLRRATPRTRLVARFAHSSISAIPRYALWLHLGYTSATSWACRHARLLALPLPCAWFPACLRREGGCPFRGASSRTRPGPLPDRPGAFLQVASLTRTEMSDSRLMLLGGQLSHCREEAAHPNGTACPGHVRHMSETRPRHIRVGGPALPKRDGRLQVAAGGQALHSAHAVLTLTLTLTLTLGGQALHRAHAVLAGQAREASRGRLPGQGPLVID